MRIKTITCHDVYNVGASLQAYALQTYLTDLGHDVEIIDYKPDYLSQHYSLWNVANPRYDKPIVKQLYLMAKLIGRLQARKSEKKKQFDDFRVERLKLTDKQYHSNEELRTNCPEADVYIAGSDQIWNPLFRNGRDPAFFLDFVTERKKISYAASFAVDKLPDDVRQQDMVWLNDFDAVSVREKSGVQLLHELGITAEHVCDPVFLLDKTHWEKLASTLSDRSGVYVYDFDNTDLIDQVLSEVKSRNDKIISYFNQHDADLHDECGPIRFLEYLQQAETIVSNSFHATAFALIFHKDFYVVRREETINKRMQDLLEAVDLSERYITEPGQVNQAGSIDWQQVEKKLKDHIVESKEFLDKALSKRRQLQ